MMFKVRLHKEVIKFLEQNTTVYLEDDVKSFIVNKTIYTETDEPEVFTTKFLNNDQYIKYGE